MPNARIPALSEVGQIAALADPVVRNLQITQCYHELALVLAERTGPSANWCTFATWASNQAGVTIRKEDLAQALKSRRGMGHPAASAAPAAQGLLASAEAMGARAG